MYKFRFTRRKRIRQRRRFKPKPLRMSKGYGALSRMISCYLSNLLINSLIPPWKGHAPFRYNTSQITSGIRPFLIANLYLRCKTVYSGGIFMNIKENDLPGIGKNSKSKREIMKMTIIIHDDGRRKFTDLMTATLMSFWQAFHLMMRKQDRLPRLSAGWCINRRRLNRLKWRSTI